MNRNIEDQPIVGAGIDRDHRPGVPMETAPARVGNAHWTEPERQSARVRVLKRASLDELTPVFSNALPPRALSGLIRRVGYRVPEHRLTHWALLLLGDRVDVLEERFKRLLQVAVPVAAAGALLSLFAPRVKISRRQRRRFLRALRLA